MFIQCHDHFRTTARHVVFPNRWLRVIREEQRPFIGIISRQEGDRRYIAVAESMAYIFWEDKTVANMMEGFICFLRQVRHDLISRYSAQICGAWIVQA